MSLKDAVGAEQYLAKHSLKTTLQWLTHEVIINKPGSPLQFLRDLLTAKINQTPSSSKKSPASGLSSGELAVLVGNAELALSKCVQAASGSKDADDRTRAAALVAGLGESWINSQVNWIQSLIQWHRCRPSGNVFQHLRQ